MSIEATTIEAPSQPAKATPPGTIHPVWVRATHWVNVLAMLMMIGSGWQIYDASPLFPFVFYCETPRLDLACISSRFDITLGGWLAGALLWHFAAMWLLVANGLVYLTLGLATGRFRRKLLPIRPGQVVADVRAALSGRLSHDDLAVYNAVQRLLYLGVILCGVVMVLSGLSLWKPVQLRELALLFGGYDMARYVHFFAMAAIVGFIAIHVIMAFLVPKSLRTMIIGR